VTVPTSTNPKPEPAERGGHLGPLVVARGDPDRVGQGDAGERRRQARVAHGEVGRAEAQEAQPGLVGGLGRQQEARPPQQAVGAQRASTPRAG
jgi:hypothetical protein